MSTEKLSVELENSFTNNFNVDVNLSGDIKPDSVTIQPGTSPASFGFSQSDNIAFTVSAGALPRLNIKYTTSTIVLQSGSQWIQIPTQNSNAYLFGYAQVTAGNTDVYIVSITYTGDVGGGIAMVGTVSMIVPK